MKRLLLVICCLALCSVEAGAQCPVQETETLDSVATTSGDFYGTAIDVDGDLAIIGARNADAGGVTSAGTATIFRRIGKGWHEEGTVSADDPDVFVGFGSAVAVCGNRALVGVPNKTVAGQGLAGAVYAFSFDGSTWVQDQKIIASDFDHQASFGYSVAIDGDLAVIGAAGADTQAGINAGSAHAFDVDVASVAPRNGGSNPNSYVASAPLLGGLWTATLDLTTTGHSQALVLMNSAPGSTALPLGQVLLVGGVELLQLPLSPGPLVSWTLPIPSDCSLLGLTIYTQAAHAQGVFPFALSNAQDLTFGY